MAGQPRKRFGQNFLVDRHVVQRIVDGIRPDGGDHLVEIGPGRGALTDALIGTAGHLSTIEIDRDLARDLEARLGRQSDFELHVADALKFDFATLQPQPLRVIGNLPYNISTPLMFHLLKSEASISDMHFMLQQEVVARMTAAPGSRQYGRLSVAIALQCEATRLFGVGPGAFVPQPRVDSAVVRLKPRGPRLGPGTRAAVDRVLIRAFSARRKTMRNVMRGQLDEAALSELGIDPGVRPETLAPDDFLRIARQLENQCD